MKWVLLINISHNLFLSQSHAGKVVMRSWYERNKHIFPASRWEPYDPEKKWDKYTVRDLPFSSIYNSVHLFRFRTKVHPQDNDDFHAIHVMFLNWQLTWSILKFAKYFKQTTQLICEQEKEKRNYEETVLVRSWKEREIDCIHNVTALHVFYQESTSNYLLMGPNNFDTWGFWYIIMLSRKWLGMWSSMESQPLLPLHPHKCWIHWGTTERERIIFEGI